MIRLKEMAEALSVSPTLLICLTKKSPTSYKGNPFEPGMIRDLLIRETNAAGRDLNSMRSNLVKAGVHFVVYGPYRHQGLFDIGSHKLNAQYTYC